MLRGASEQALELFGVPWFMTFCTLTRTHPKEPSPLKHSTLRKVPLRTSRAAGCQHTAPPPSTCERPTKRMPQMWRGVPLPRPLEGRLLVRRRTTHRAEAELKALRGAAELGVGVAEGFPHLARRAEAGRAENERFVQTPGHLPQTLHGTAIYAYIDPQNHLN